MAVYAILGSMRTRTITEADLVVGTKLVRTSALSETPIYGEILSVKWFDTKWEPLKPIKPPISNRRFSIRIKVDWGPTSRTTYYENGNMGVWEVITDPIDDLIEALDE